MSSCTPAGSCFDNQADIFTEPKLIKVQNGSVGHVTSTGLGLGHAIPILRWLGNADYTSGEWVPYRAGITPITLNPQNPSQYITLPGTYKLDVSGITHMTQPRVRLYCETMSAAEWQTLNIPCGDCNKPTYYGTDLTYENRQVVVQIVCDPSGVAVETLGIFSSTTGAFTPVSVYNTTPEVLNTTGFITRLSGAFDAVNQRVVLRNGLVESVTYTLLSDPTTTVTLGADGVFAEQVKVVTMETHSIKINAAGVPLTFSPIQNSSNDTVPNHAYIYVQVEQSATDAGIHGIGYTVDGTLPTDDVLYQLSAGEGAVLSTHAEIAGFMAVPLDQHGKIYTGTEHITLTVTLSNIDPKHSDKL